MKRWHIGVLGVIVFAGGAVAGALWARRGSARAEEKYRQFCNATRDAIRQDRRDFESEDLVRREAADRRFYEGMTMYHNHQSLLMCIDDLPHLDVFCHLEQDWKCLADLARRIENQLDDASWR